jgi:hypothetical protein
MTAYDKLPLGVQSAEWAGILGSWDDEIISLRSQLDPVSFDAKFFDPATSTDLDWRAQTSLWRGLWQVAWSDHTKRALLANQVEIWQGRYDAINTLPKLFNWFDLDATVEAVAGFRLGVDQTPAMLGVSLQNYVVKVSPTYTPGTLERIRVEQLMDSFGLPIRFPIEYR